MYITMNPNLSNIASCFCLKGEVQSIIPYGEGLINDTYKLITGSFSPDYILQRINNAIFRDVDMLQENISKVTSHIRSKLEAAGEKDLDRKVLRFIPAKSGKMYHKEDGKYWRVMVFIDGAITYQAVTPEYSYYAGLAFGDFESKLADMNESLGEIIPDFHNIEFRLKQLDDACAADPKRRVSKVQDILDEIQKREIFMTLSERL